VFNVTTIGEGLGFNANRLLAWGLSYAFESILFCDTLFIFMERPGPFIFTEMFGLFICTERLGTLEPQKNVTSSLELHFRRDFQVE
jgi:hypothetical protein